MTSESRTEHEQIQSAGKTSTKFAEPKVHDSRDRKISKH